MDSNHAPRVPYDTGGIDRDLEWSLAVWRGLPEAAGEISEWDVIERLDFVYEWPLEEMRLDRLREQKRVGLMNAEQAVQMAELENLVARNRPVSEELLRRHL